MTVRVRFAPSPTGSLHLGNARTALFNWLFARRHEGVFILRIEDTDVEREVEGADRALREDLTWLGITWDEGPDLGAERGPYGPYHQSKRGPLYLEKARALIDAGAAYYCFCAPEQIEEDRRRFASEGKTPRYSGRCREIPAAEARRRIGTGQAAAVRLRVASFPAVEDLLRGLVDFSAREPSDVVLLRSDGRPTYNFAVVVDDAAMRISHVLRGDDHLSNTPVQMRIYEALGSAPPMFGHLPTVLGPDGSPLSKRHGAVSLAEMRRGGCPAEGLAGALMLLGWTPPPEAADALLDLRHAAKLFELDRVSRSPATFDPPRLRHLATLAIAAMKPADRAARLLEWLEAAEEEAAAWMRSLPREGWGEEGAEWLGSLLDLWSGQVARFADYAPNARFIFRYEESLAKAESTVRAELAQPECRSVLRAFLEILDSAAPLVTVEKYQQAARDAGTRAASRGRSLFHPLRLAITAAQSGPELQRLVPLIERASSLRLPIQVISVRERVVLALDSAIREAE